MVVFKVLNLRAYIYYKLLNSFFLGLSVGVVFFIYTPLEPSVFSIGGVFLAVGLLVIAKIYEKIINYKTFFQISFGIEILMLIMILVFIIFASSYTSAFIIYLGYQITFMFGSYLIRAETYFLNRKKLLSFVDVAKQIGYLVGMIFSFLFYKVLEFLEISNEGQVLDVHFLMLITEVFIILYILKGFRKL